MILMILVNYTVSGQKIITDRPDQTESSSTVMKKSLQVESGILLGFSDNDTLSERHFIGPSTLFRYGVTQGLEIRVVNQFISIRNKNTKEEITGIGDLEIGAKIQILQKEDVNTEIAFLTHVVLPTGSSDVSIGNYGTINKLSISHELSKNIGIGYNVGYNYFGIYNGFFTYSVVLGIGITDKAGIYLEPYGQIGIFGDKHLANFDAGVTYLIKDNFQLDLSFGLGINYNMNYIATGFSWNIGMLNKD